MEEQAIDPLAGGIYQHGYQCGMLWGAAMALGTEAYKRKDDQGEAIALAVIATAHIMKSFKPKADSIDCEDITETDFNNKLQFAKYMLTGKAFGCFNLAAKWAPDAIQEAKVGLELEIPNESTNTKSCASEVIKKMGGSDEESVMVAGFAGGLGLSGKGCGALAAAMWKMTLEIVKKGEWKYSTNNPIFDKMIEEFYQVSDYRMECSEICGKKFNSLEEHSDYIRDGGCKDIIAKLAKS